MGYIPDKPEHIKISLTNVCNYQCIMCYNPVLQQKRGFIEDGLIYKILDECKRLNINKVSLGATGEPLMHKRFIDYLKYAKSLGLWVSTCTNCSLLTREVAGALIDYKMDHITLSNYSADDSEHEKYTGTRLFDRVFENINYFLTLRQENENNTIVDMDFIDILGVNNYDRFVKVWGPVTRKFGLPRFYFPVRYLQNWGSRVNVGSKKPLKYPLMLEKHNGEARMLWQHKTRCPLLHSYLYIGYDGSVYPCCNIPEAVGCEEVLFGDLNRKGIMDIWHSERYRRFRQDHHNNEVSKYTPCRNCSARMPVWQLRISPKGFADMGSYIFNKAKRACGKYIYSN